MVEGPYKVVNHCTRTQTKEEERTVAEEENEKPGEPENNDSSNMDNYRKQGRTKSELENRIAQKMGVRGKERVSQPQIWFHWFEADEYDVTIPGYLPHHCQQSITIVTSNSR